MTPDLSDPLSVADRKASIEVIPLCMFFEGVPLGVFFVEFYLELATEDLFE